MDANNTTLGAAFLAENRQREVYATHITFFILMMLIVPARFASARAAKKPLLWDDWLAGVAALSTVGVFVGTMLWLRFGLGRHSAVVAREDPKNIPRFFQTIMANEILYTTGLACARLSLVAFFYHIFGVTNMRFYLHGFVCAIMAWALATYILSIRTCWPIESFWDGTQQNCINIFNFYVGVAVGSILIDFGLMILPIPYIWGLTMPWYHKVCVVFALIFGGFACFVTIIRLVKIVQIDFADPTWGTVDLMIWTGMEIYCAVICCCLPTLKPLIRLIGRHFKILSWPSTPSNSHSSTVRLSSQGLPRYQKNPASTHSIERILNASSEGDLELSGYGRLESIN